MDVFYGLKVGCPIYFCGAQLIAEYERLDHINAEDDKEGFNT